MNTTKPVRKPGIIVQDIGGEMLLYSAEGKAVHVLNPTAKRIWDLCDGGHTAEDMEQALRASFSIAAERDVAGDLQRTLEVFAAKGLLQGG
jgi:hypothetical protein